MRKFSLVDYPGKLACIVFVGNCNCRCPYCHNPCLVFDPESQPHIPESEVFDFLERRRGKLDGVVISGGEASLRQGLHGFCAKIKNMGFAIKLDTNGTNPDKVIGAHSLGLIDALGIDYKAPADIYHQIARSSMRDLPIRVQKLICYAVEKNIPLDVRTTVHKSLLSVEDLKRMRVELDLIGLREWTLQQFHPVDIIDDELLQSPTYSDRELLKIANSLGNHTRVRGLAGILLEKMSV